MADAEIADIHFLFGSVELQATQGISLIEDGNRYDPVYFSQPGGGLAVSANYRFDFAGYRHISSNQGGRKLRVVFHMDLIHIFRDWNKQPGDCSYYLGGRTPSAGILQGLVKRYLDPNFWKGFSKVYIYGPDVGSRERSTEFGSVSYEQRGSMHRTQFEINLLLNEIG
jgi:hypothetical protein